MTKNSLIGIILVVIAVAAVLIVLRPMPSEKQRVDFSVWNIDILKTEENYWILFNVERPFANGATFYNCKIEATYLTKTGIWKNTSRAILGDDGTWRYEKIKDFPCIIIPTLYLDNDFQSSDPKLTIGEDFRDADGEPNLIVKAYGYK